MIENVGRRSENWSEDGAPPDIGEASLNGYERNVLFWNQGDGRFVDVAYLAGANRIEDGRGVAVADFDRDGRLDLLLQNLDRPAVLCHGLYGDNPAAKADVQRARQLLKTRPATTPTAASP